MKKSNSGTMELLGEKVTVTWRERKRLKGKGQCMGGRETRKAEVERVNSTRKTEGA